MILLKTISSAICVCLLILLNHSVLLAQPTSTSGHIDEPHTPSPNAQQPTAIPPLAPKPADLRPHNLQMRLSGSTCVACLAELERAINTLDGVSTVKIIYPTNSLSSFYAAAGANYVEAELQYHPTKITLTEILQFFKSKGYYGYKIVDRPSK